MSGVLLRKKEFGRPGVDSWEKAGTKRVVLGAIRWVCGGKREHLCYVAGMCQQFFNV
jgi:hypothetical protein